jgi:uncharacterized membrane protein YkvA (DUF1232 family)
VTTDATEREPSEDPSLPDPAAAGRDSLPAAGPPEGGDVRESAHVPADGVVTRAGAEDPRDPAAGPAAWRPTRWSSEGLHLLPDLARLLRALVNDPRVPRRAKVVAAASAAYVASPIDLLPDVIPTVGGVDDLVVVLGAVRYLVATAGYDLVRELWTGNDAGFSMVIVLAGVQK